MSGVNFTFRLFQGTQLLREESLALPVIKIGKLSSSHLRLDDDNVSRMHAVIEVTGPDDVSIIDLGSTTGTFVNGEKVNKAKIKSGDQLTIGGTRIEVSFRVGEAAAARTQAASIPVPMAPAPFAQAAAPAPFAAPAPSRGPAPFAAPPIGGGAAAYSGDIDEPGASAVEVAAMLDQSVVSVKHLMEPKGGTVSGTTKGYFALGALLLLAAGVAFIIAVRNASYNAAKHDEWVNVLKRPEFAFRPNMVGQVYDAIALAGLVGGLSLFVMGLARARRERRSPLFRIGSAPGVEFSTSHAPAESFLLVGPQGNDFVFNAAPGMEGEVTVNGQSSPLPSGSFAVPAQGRIKAKLGNITYLVTAVGKPKEYPVPFWSSLDGSFLTYAGATFIAIFGFLGILYTVAPPSDLIDADMGLDDSGLASARNNAKDDPKQEEPPPEENADDEEAGGTGTRMALDEGKMGKKDSNRAEGQFKMAKNSDEQVIARQASESAASGGAIGAAFASQGGAVFASLTGTGDISSGLDDVDIQGGLLGDAPGEMAGGFGFGQSGFGPGGGGTGWGTIGLGNQGRIGHGSGTGSGYGTGSGRGGGRARTSVVPEPRLGTPDVGGDLDPATIRRYIRRNIEKIRSCYERQLLAKPTLQGTVTAQFFISPTGTVTTSTASGLDSAVSSCLAGVIKNIEFPKPKGGGGVQVKSYPFEFRPSGG